MMYPEDQACKTWEKDGVRYSLVNAGHYCGYCRMPRRVVKENGYRGIVTYVPVHGGITYAKQDEEGMIYGFDCNHLGDNRNEDTWDEAWLVEQCELMAKGIIIAAQFEDEYLLADNEKRGEIIERYFRALGMKDYDFTTNFGILINVLGGEL